MKRIWIALIGLLCIVEGIGQGIIIPIELNEDTEMADWTEEAAPEVYEGDLLFDLINGGAELYFEYGFKRVISYKFIHENGSRISAEMYQMDTDSSAFGIYSIQKPSDGETLSIEQQCILKENYISLWRGDYFIMISGDFKDNQSKKALNHLAGILSAKVNSNGEVPVIIEELMDDDNPPSRLIYFKGNIALSNVYSFDYKDVFQIEDGAIIVDEDLKAVIFRYKEGEKGTEIYSTAKEHFKDHKKFSEFKEMDAYFSMIDRKGRTVTISSSKHYVIGVVHSLELYAPDLIDPILQKLK